MRVGASKTMESVVGELEGTLVKESDPFPYLMLVAFEASGPIRFAFLLLVWPLVRLLGLVGLRDAGLKLAVFVAVVGVRISDIEYVGRAVLPKFYMDYINMDAWRVFGRYGRRIVVSKSPQMMVERFAKEHLGADQVIGSELIVNRFGRATGLFVSCRVDKVFGGVEPCLGLGRPATSFMSYCEEQCHPPFFGNGLPKDQQQNQLKHPTPVVFHDGRLAKFPKPAIAMLILLWFPIGVTIAIIRMVIALVLPIGVIHAINRVESLLYGMFIIVKGVPPKPVLPTSDSSNGVLFVCNHRSVLDSVVVVVALKRKISVVSYSVSRITEILAPFRFVRLARNREVDAKKIEDELKRGDTIIFPEGTTCREPYLLRFSALFAELTDRIALVAINYKPLLFHPTTARGWKGLDPFFFFMNPISFYEITFLDQQPLTATCSFGKSIYDVANNLQRILASTLGFECTKFTRKDKYMLLKGNDGSV